jgi:hypothetical protein
LTDYFLFYFIKVMVFYCDIKTNFSVSYIFLELKNGVSEKIVQNLSCSLKDFIFICIWGVMFIYMGLHIVTGLDYIYPVINL